ncbi:bifunctional diguanylate cyclase/phosphodiesterase [Arcobacter sp. CECT 8985]|uniref:bifunctional diguanylate cyclase/phosphodiesterase n=1 Tax=Arcobacter sp. CECT 8985 TaxID=1935424 RepID=UPI00100BF2B6|nr:bifunctional diguanylate cyclase/phosphodiesterase [Arcobacter sp. CECT 8985]RXJ83262.1 diguanylate cyclase [Arcobacter sp. CECT 8985]
MKKSTTYKKLITKIILFTLFVTLIIALAYGEYLKKDAIEKLTKIDSKKTSKLIFQSLYSAMEKGWNKKDLAKIIDRINSIDEEMSVNVYRSSLVAKLYGEIEEDKKVRKANPFVKKAFHKEEVLNIIDESLIQFYYPIIAEKQCLECHSNAKSGDVLGVIDISYPVRDLKVSLTSMINFFVIFIIVFSLVLFIALYFGFDKHLVKPIKIFVNKISQITEEKDIKQRVELNDKIEELSSMQRVFNKMLDSLEYQFYNDELTSLPNRKKLLEVANSNRYASLTLINIDKFQEINDLYGDKVGNNLLVHISELLKENSPKSAKLFKLHADEYALYYEQDISLEELQSLILYLIDIIEKNIFVVKEGNEAHVNISAGIAVGNEALLTNADIALKIAKRKRKKYVLYDSSMKIEHEYEQNLKWGKKIKDAIKDDRIVPLFQPIVNTQTKEIIKYESLIRLQDTNGELISPIHFLDLAKKNKLYPQLTMIMVRKTFEIFSKIDKKISINLSVDDILNKEVYDCIMTHLKISNFGNRVVFELIESEGIENFDEVLNFIEEVKTYGCQISIDDFGTGYSNFEYLMKLKVDYIKIDASMIKNIDVNKNSQMVTETIIDFANKMGIETIAEFIHSENVYKKVKEIGIHYSQGYYFGEPMKLD